MEFEWDAAKNRANIEKHGIGFETAARIFEGPVLSAIDARFDYGELRENSIGMIEGVLAVIVIHTDRDGVKRIISARPAKAAERKRYEQAIRERTQRL